MAEPQFDVFLCHNSEDKPAVIEIAQQLQKKGLKPWLDVWELQPGAIWQFVLEQQIETIGAAAVFVGKQGLGPWQSEEIYAFLQEFIRRKCPVIPVLLPNAPQQPHLPIFLKNRHWVDFRLQNPDPLIQLIWGITGKKPEESLSNALVIEPTEVSEDINLAINTQDELTVLREELKRLRKQQKTANSPAALTSSRRETGSEISSNSLERVDYEHLRKLLQKGDWKEADLSTLQILLTASNRQVEGWLRTEDINAIPAEVFEKIDQLWIRYSDGKFGFSIQKEVWENFGCPLTADGAWENFGVQVGWYKAGNWISYAESRFSIAAPRGHLPAAGMSSMRSNLGRGKPLIALFRRSDVHFTSKLNTIGENQLESERKVDYTRLRELLKAGKWKEADLETVYRMLEAAGRHKRDWSPVEAINDIPCRDLRTIDSLWVQYSDAQFGLSVQKKLFLDCCREKFLGHLD